MKGVLDNLQTKLTNTNRIVFRLRVKQRRYGLTEEERVIFRKMIALQKRYKAQIRGLKNKMGVR